RREKNALWWDGIKLGPPLQKSRPIWDTAAERQQRSRDIRLGVPDPLFRKGLVRTDRTTDIPPSCVACEIVRQGPHGISRIGLPGPYRHYSTPLGRCLARVVTSSALSAASYSRTSRSLPL